ncbi:hypothetical protein F5887DRAFT_898295 [Amanita rubescens]|nr:hypothetical protein F5887DRAFT_898295 [Amanita rubescens]
MSSAKYQRLPTTDNPTGGEKNSPRSSFDASTSSYTADTRFHQPTPSPYARAALLIFIVFMFWLAFAMRKLMWLGGSAPPPGVEVIF